jgi:hypothetical protein
VAVVWQPKLAAPDMDEGAPSRALQLMLGADLAGLQGAAIHGFDVAVEDL